MWYPDDANLLTPLELVDDNAAKFIDEPTLANPYVQNYTTENISVLSNKFIVPFVTMGAETKSPETVHEALTSPAKSEWQATMAAQRRGG